MTMGKIGTKLIRGFLLFQAMAQIPPRTMMATLTTTTVSVAILVETALVRSLTLHLESRCDVTKNDSD